MDVPGENRHPSVTRVAKKWQVHTVSDLGRGVRALHRWITDAREPGFRSDGGPLGPRASV
jgi:hypothetical protein